MPYKDPHAPENVARMRSYRRKHYRENPQPYKDRAKVSREAMIAWYRDLKHMKPCTDCEVAYPAYVMHWDHLRDKELHLAAVLRLGWSKTRIMAEIAKCELVCSNCHAIRTWSRNHPD